MAHFNHFILHISVKFSFYFFSNCRGDQQVGHSRMEPGEESTPLCPPGTAEVSTMRNNRCSRHLIWTIIENIWERFDYDFIAFLLEGFDSSQSRESLLYEENPGADPRAAETHLQMWLSSNHTTMWSSITNFTSELNYSKAGKVWYRFRETWQLQGEVHDE